MGRSRCSNHEATPIHRLQATLWFTDGRDGFAIDNIDIETADVASAIGLALDWRPERSDLVSDVLMLMCLEGNVVWSLQRAGEP